MAQIGVFFCLEDILTKQYNIQEGIRQGILYNPPEGHDRVWRKQFEETYKEKYDFWPRGRVAYNTNSRQYIIYYDKCLTQDTLDQVRKLFGIDENQVRYIIDEYYSCHICSHKWIDDEEFYDSF